MQTYVVCVCVCVGIIDGPDPVVCSHYAVRSLELWQHLSAAPLCNQPSLTTTTANKAVKGKRRLQPHARAEKQQRRNLRLQVMECWSSLLLDTPSGSSVCSVIQQTKASRLNWTLVIVTTFASIVSCEKTKQRQGARLAGRK